MTVNSHTHYTLPLSPAASARDLRLQDIQVLLGHSFHLWTALARSKFPIRLNSVSPSAVFPVVLTQLPTSHGHQAPSSMLQGDPGDGMWPLDKKDLEMRLPLPFAK